MVEDDDQLVTRARLSIELERLRITLETERLERELKALRYWYPALAFLIYGTLLVVILHHFLSK
jgi:hypothetical protein